MSLLGIDVGTSGCKAAAFSPEGAILARAYREYPTLYAAPGHAELDSARVWQLIRQAIAEVAAKTARDPVTALCVSAMGEAVTPVSRDRRILGNAILCTDVRGGQYIDELRRRISDQAFYRINRNPLSSAYTLPKLLWLKEHDPRLYAQADMFLLWDGLVPFMLGCDAFTSFSHASRTLLFDLNKEDWSEELLAVSGIDGGKLAPCRAGGTVAGTVGDQIAGELGLPRGVRIIVGGHDQCCNALGAGIAAPGRAVDGIGTFECITPVFRRVPAPDVSLRHGLSIEPHVLPGLYVSFLFNQAGALVRWFRDTFAADERDAEDIYQRLDGELPEEPTGLMVLPYFETTGPPGYVSDASGVVAGLKTSTRRGEILKAIMEGVTFYFAENLHALQNAGVEISSLVATGGGSRSDRWVQIKADILGVPYERPAITECSVLGAAILAGAATGIFDSAAEGARRFVHPERFFEPDARRHAVYQERLQRYSELFPLMREYLQSLNKQAGVAQKPMTLSLGDSGWHAQRHANY